MLEPDTRYLLLDSLRPPPGYSLDMAVGTSFTLNLHTLVTVPIAFAMFDQQHADGSLRDDPIATLQALRENADRITLFSQAGQTGVPEEYRSVFVYLEDSIYPVVSPDPDAFFHPKVWYLRYRSSHDEDFHYRFLCLSRNLTFDRSWDTVLRLDGKISDSVHAPELARFTDSLLTMARPTRPVAHDRSTAILGLGEEFSRVQWNLPTNFDSIKFCPLGDDGKARNPFPSSYQRFLIVSPFLTQEPVRRLTKSPGIEQSVVLSRPESFESLGAKATDHLDERLVLASDAASSDEVEDDSAVTETVAESVRGTLAGLHAKLYVMDEGNRSRILTGSANATWSAFNRNVEFLVELGGPTEHVGVHATIGNQNDRLGLRAIVEPFDPPNDLPRELSASERAEIALDKASRLLGGLRFIAHCTELKEDQWRLSLEGRATDVSICRPELGEISARVRPITLGEGYQLRPVIAGQLLTVSFELSEAAVTPYFAFSLSLEESSTSFLITADLVNPPPDREANVLRNLLSNRQDFIRLLLLLLGNIDDALAAFESNGASELPIKWLPGFGSDALLEPLVRAFARDPQRLRDVERLLMDLESDESRGESVLPEGWWEIWRPIAEALESESQK